MSPVKRALAAALALSCLLVLSIMTDAPGFPLPTIFLEQQTQPLKNASQILTEPVDLNHATVQQLIALPGIGEKTAQAILEYRQSIGRFTAVEQLLQVENIGEKTLEKLRPYLILE